MRYLGRQLEEPYEGLVGYVGAIAGENHDQDAEYARYRGHHVVLQLVALVAHEDDGRGGQYAYQRRGQVVRFRNGIHCPEFLREDSRVRVSYDECSEQGYPWEYGSQDPYKNTDTLQPDFFCIGGGLVAHGIPLFIIHCLI